MPLSNPNGFSRIINSAQEDANAREAYMNSPEFVNDPDNLALQLQDLINGMFDSFQNNVSIFQDVKDTNIDEAEKAFDRQKQLLDISSKIARELRSTAIQDTVEDLQRAGINPAVYFSRGGSPNSSIGLTPGSVNAASVGNPASDTLSSLVNSYANILASIASNKNADTAVLRSCISALGSIFSFSKNFSKSQNLSTILSDSDDSRYSRNNIGF